MSFWEKGHTSSVAVPTTPHDLTTSQNRSREQTPTYVSLHHADALFSQPDCPRDPRPPMQASLPQSSSTCPRLSQTARGEKLIAPLTSYSKQERSQAQQDKKHKSVPRRPAEEETSPGMGVASGVLTPPPRTALGKEPNAAQAMPIPRENNQENQKACPTTGRRPAPPASRLLSPHSDLCPRVSLTQPRYLSFQQI